MVAVRKTTANKMFRAWDSMHRSGEIGDSMFLNDSDMSRIINRAKLSEKEQFHESFNTESIRVLGDMIHDAPSRKRDPWLR